MMAFPALDRYLCRKRFIRYALKALFRPTTTIAKPRCYHLALPESCVSTIISRIEITKPCI